MACLVLLEHPGKPRGAYRRTMIRSAKSVSALARPTFPGYSTHAQKRLPMGAAFVYVAEREVLFGAARLTLRAAACGDVLPRNARSSNPTCLSPGARIPAIRHTQKRLPMGAAFVCMAEREGFEPSVRGYRTHAFQACSFDRSDTSPVLLWMIVRRFKGRKVKPRRRGPQACQRLGPGP